MYYILYTTSYTLYIIYYILDIRYYILDIIYIYIYIFNGYAVIPPTPNCCGKDLTNGSE